MKTKEGLHFCLSLLQKSDKMLALSQILLNSDLGKQLLLKRQPSGMHMPKALTLSKKIPK